MILTIKVPAAVSRYPEAIITHYVWDQFKNIAPQTYQKYYQASYDSSGGIISPLEPSMIPIFPYTEEPNIPDELKNSQLPYAIWDTFIKTRTTYRTFYPIKSHQMRYKFKGNFSDLMAYLQIFVDVLDRGDDAAKDINEWYGNNSIAAPSVYFHCVNAFQTGYIESATDSKSFREQPVGDLIVKFDYHRNSVFNDGSTLS
jgi:hypothetical protein